MKCVVYRSYATRALHSDDVHNIVAAAQKRNIQHGVTGILLFNSVQFIQALEGDDMDIEYIMSFIMGDPRHSNIEILSDETIESRQFSEWAMKLVPFVAGGSIDADLAHRLPTNMKKAVTLA